MAFDQGKADRICARLAEDGLTLREAVKPEGISAGGFLLWCSINEGLAEQYARAMAVRTEQDAADLDELQNAEPERDDKGRVDPGWVSWRKLQIDTRKWSMSKRVPKKYGERVTTEVTGRDGGPIESKDVSDNEVARRFAHLLVSGLAAKEK